MKPDLARAFLDLSTFTGDDWSVQATADVPSVEDVPRLVVRTLPVRISLRPLNGLKVGSASVADDVTVCDVRVIRLLKDQRGVEFGEFLDSVNESTGSSIKLWRGVIEDDLAPGDRIIVGLPSLTAGAGSAAGLAVYVTGAELESNYV